ncbi:hypothetical protein C8F01DRAFT_792923 [Mycena amicta]|nr:hypothetical protein C8F01DRAFT_792923 [Mycena amicta]
MLQGDIIHSRKTRPSPRDGALANQIFLCQMGFASEAALSTIDSGEATSQYTSIEDEETNDALLSVLRSTSTVNADTTSPMPVLIEDISAWDKHLPSGGTLYSVHVPTRASEWLDTHAEYELLTQLHVHEAFGPFAYQLTPDEEGFVVFARLSSSGLRELVHELVNASGFPIIMRPYEEYPLAADIRPDNNLTQMERLRGRLGFVSFGCARAVPKGQLNG